MNKALRKTVIAGNWKMNETASQARELIGQLLPLIRGKDGCGIIICTPFTDLAVAAELTKGTNVKVGAQNVHFAAKGAYTGEISASMLTELGIEYVIIGHSERRAYFGETDETVNQRVKAAVAAGLTVILCVGETLEQRDAGEKETVISTQIKADLDGLTTDDMKKVIIAYEPIWAIGTGRTATADQAEEVCAYIRSLLSDEYGAPAANSVTIQYGGSMNAANAAELLSRANVDGGLIGGASLKPADFAAIIEAAQ